jgi:hypothetical protein
MRTGAPLDRALIFPTYMAVRDSNDIPVPGRGTPNLLRIAKSPGEYIERW